MRQAALSLCSQAVERAKRELLTAHHPCCRICECRLSRSGQTLRSERAGVDLAGSKCEASLGPKAQRCRLSTGHRLLEQAVSRIDAADALHIRCGPEPLSRAPGLKLSHLCLGQRSSPRAILLRFRNLHCKTDPMRFAVRTFVFAHRFC